MAKNPEGKHDFTRIPMPTPYILEMIYGSIERGCYDEKTKQFTFDEIDPENYPFACLEEQNIERKQKSKKKTGRKNLPIVTVPTTPTPMRHFNPNASSSPVIRSRPSTPRSDHSYKVFFQLRLHTQSC